MLSVDDVVKDYDAVMTSVDHLKTIWPGGSWPEGLTLRQNLVDLGWHEKEFQLRQSFAYTVLSPTEDRVLGCVYIYPSRKVGLDASITFGLAKRAGERDGRPPLRRSQKLAPDFMAVHSGGFPGTRHALARLASKTRPAALNRYGWTQPPLLT